MNFDDMVETEQVAYTVQKVGMRAEASPWEARTPGWYSQTAQELAQSMRRFAEGADCDLLDTPIIRVVMYAEQRAITREARAYPDEPVVMPAHLDHLVRLRMKEMR